MLTHHAHRTMTDDGQRPVLRWAKNTKLNDQQIKMVSHYFWYDRCETNCQHCKHSLSNWRQWKSADIAKLNSFCWPRILLIMVHCCTGGGSIVFLSFCCLVVFLFSRKLLFVNACDHKPDTKPTCKTRRWEYITASQIEHTNTWTKMTVFVLN